MQGLFYTFILPLLITEILKQSTSYKYIEANQILLYQIMFGDVLNKWLHFYKPYLKDYKKLTCLIYSLELFKKSKQNIPNFVPLEEFITDDNFEENSNFFSPLLQNFKDTTKPN